MSALCSLTLKLMLILLASGQARLDRPLYVGGTDDPLQYDDGTAAWLCWGGLYRGTWFNINDFGFYYGWYASQSQLWFFHHSSYPWDVSSFYCELYNGDQAGPVTQLDQTSVTATHYQPVYANYSPAITCQANFWIICNTEMSSGGWPSILGDDTPNVTGFAHSFYSFDFIEWIPWPTGLGFSNATWGGVKALYGCQPLSSSDFCDYLIRSNGG